jgi:hypothetical protein
MSMRTVGVTVMALLLGSCSLLNAPEATDLCSEHGASCDQNAECVAGASSYRCVCGAGYRDVRGDGTLCRDRDECVDGSARCHVRATCTNTKGSYECACPPDDLESLDGKQCEELNQCLTGQHDCDTQSQVCIDVEGPEWTCSCKRGYESVDGGACQDVDDCQDGKHDCQAPAQCVENDDEEGGFRCLCPAGTIPLDRRRCEARDPCAAGEHDCGENTRCVADGDEHRCECLEGYEPVDSARCRDIDECLTSPCKDSAQCRNTAGTFSCDCPGYYSEVDGGCADDRLLWAESLGSHLLMQPLADKEGNLVLAGTFAGTITGPFAGGVSEGIVPCVDSLGPSKDFDVFVVKLGPLRHSAGGSLERECVWQEWYGADTLDEVIGATIDEDGNPVLNIVFSGLLNLRGIEQPYSGGFPARAIVKLDGGTGRALWASVFYNVDAKNVHDRILYGGLSTDGQRDVLWTGTVRTGVALDIGRNVEVANAKLDAVVAKLDANTGALLWWKPLVGRFTSRGSAITATATGDVVVAGIFEESILIDDREPPLQSALQSNGISSGFAAALTADGKLVRWQTLIDGNLEPNDRRTSGLGVTVADGDQVVVGGSFRGDLAIGDEPTSAGERDVFLLGLDARSGAPTWLRTFGNSADDVLHQLASANGELVAVGSFANMLDLGDSTFSAFGRDIFALTFDAQGEPRWAQRFGGNGTEHMAAVTKSPQTGQTFVTAAFSSAVTVGGSEVQPRGPESGFVLELRP